jgi:hypothetical protein
MDDELETAATQRDSARDSGGGTRDEGPGTKDSGRRTRDEGLGTKDPGRRTWDERRGTKDSVRWRRQRTPFGLRCAKNRDVAVSLRPRVKEIVVGPGGAGIAGAVECTRQPELRGWQERRKGIGTAMLQHLPEFVGGRTPITAREQRDTADVRRRQLRDQAQFVRHGGAQAIDGVGGTIPSQCDKSLGHRHVSDPNEGRR